MLDKEVAERMFLEYRDCSYRSLNMLLCILGSYVVERKHAAGIFLTAKKEAGLRALPTVLE